MKLYRTLLIILIIDNFVLAGMAIWFMFAK